VTRPASSKTEEETFWERVRSASFGLVVVLAECRAGCECECDGDGDGDTAAGGEKEMRCVGERAPKMSSS